MKDDARRVEFPRSRAGLSAIRAHLLDRHNHRCQACGATENLQLAAIVPFGEGGDSSPDNFLILCPNCHARYDSFRPQEAEFNTFLCQLLAENPQYANPSLEKLLDSKNRARADLFADRIAGGRRQSVLVECKSRGFFRGNQLDDAIRQIDRYRALVKPDIAALAFPGRLSPNDRSKLIDAGIELWDIDYIASHFRDQIAHSNHVGFKSLFAPFITGVSSEGLTAISNRLASCKPGKEDWVVYQKLIRDVFELLFVPPLDVPIWELPDESNTNRRDLILPNYADDGFWKFLREAYQADYIVVDAKNYKGPVSKAQVLQVAHYLKPHGAGMFAIIASRAGADHGAKITQREQWAMHRKLVIVLNDKDVEAMLIAASSREQPEKVIGQIIQEFRLSM